MSTRPFPPDTNFGPKAKFGIVDGAPCSFEDHMAWSWSTGKPERIPSGLFIEDAKFISRDEFMRAITSPTKNSGQSDLRFPPGTIFGVLDNGELATESEYDWRTWPDGKRIMGSMFREDATLISEEEFRRRLAASEGRK